MDQKRLFLAIGISVLILMVFQFLAPPRPHPPAVPVPVTTQSSPLTPVEGGPGALGGSQPAAATAEPAEVPRVKIDAPRVQGSISLRGARIDDLVLTDYRETIEPNAPLVRLLEPKAQPQPYFVQFGWSNAAGTQAKLPASDTVWTASGDHMTATKPVTLSWDNGEGLIFQITLSVDENFMFAAQQSVRNTSAAAVTLYPWARIRRDYLPQVSGYYILFEGLLGVANGRLQETSYASAKSEGAKHDGLAFEQAGNGGWAGITDKYWLTALIPDQSAPTTVAFRHFTEDGGDRFQVDYLAQTPQTIAAGAEATLPPTHLFAGAKVVSIINAYERQLNIPMFWKAVDFGWFFFLTRPMFSVLDWLNNHLGNFGVAILVFTVLVKGLFFPLANYSYRSMSKMKLLAPKMTALREQLKDEPAKLQSAMMQLYKAEKVNPASGCLPMIVQIPVFFSLYKVIFVTIEMRQAPFFGWIRDLSQVDPTNIFNLFGLLPFDPTTISPLLHLGVWPIIMGITMFFQQKLNPPPPDPVQARLFQFMPIIFTFMLARFPAGLVIYWSWNNTLSILQQWVIQRRTRLASPRMART